VVSAAVEKYIHEGAEDVHRHSAVAEADHVVVVEVVRAQRGWGRRRGEKREYVVEDLERVLVLGGSFRLL
jgi:hypothetical protein